MEHFPGGPLEETPAEAKPVFTQEPVPQKENVDELENFIEQATK